MSSEILGKTIPLYQLPLIRKDVLIRDERPAQAHLHLAVALDGAGWHPAAWREADAEPQRLFTAGYWTELARHAERGLLDFLTIEDGLDLQSDDRFQADARLDRVRGRLDAVLIAARAAPATRHIGFVPTAITTHTEPFHLSKAIATLDYVSSGRAGIRVQVGVRAGRRPTSADSADVGFVTPHDAAHAAEIVMQIRTEQATSARPPWSRPWTATGLVPAFRGPRPAHVSVSADVVVAGTEAAARELATGYGLWVRSIRTAEGAIQFPTPEQARRHVWSDADRELVADRIDTQFVGTPGQVADQLERLRDATEADELIITTITHDHADRVRSYQLLAEEWARR